jgi:hypothetical protein
MYVQEISASRVVEVVPWHGGVTNIILLHTYNILSQNFTKTFSSHGSQFTREVLAASMSRTETDLSLLSAVPVYRLVPSFPVCFS